MPSVPVLITAVVTGCLLLGGCSDAPDPSEPVAMGARGPEPAPTWFTGRDPLPSCGAVELDPAEQVPAEASSCLDAGRDAEGAELVMTTYTVEGDPIVQHWRVLPGRAGIDRMDDASRDRYGTTGWLWLRCPEGDLGELGDCDLVAD